MSVIRVVRQPESRQGPDMRPGGLRTYRDVYTVVTDHVNDTGNVVVAALPVRLGMAFEDDAGAICNRISPRQRDSDMVWDVEVTYDSDTGDPDEPVDPTERPPQYSWSRYTIEEYTGRDIEGTPYVDAAGTPFDPPPPRRLTILVLTVSRYELSYNPHVAFQYADAVNSDIFLGFEPGACRMAAPIASEENYEGQPVMKTIYEIEIHPRLWVPTRILNAGPKYVDENGNIRIAADDLETSYDGVVPLNDDGTKRTINEFKTQPIELEFKQYWSRPFAPLNL